MSSFPKCPRTPWDHSWVGQIEEIKLGFCHLNYKSFLMNTWTKSIAMLHNPHFAGLKIIFHSIINGLHNWLCPYPSVWSFVQNDFPFMAQSCHFHFDKILLFQLSTSWASQLFSLHTSKVKTKSNLSKASPKPYHACTTLRELSPHFSSKSSYRAERL